MQPTSNPSEYQVCVTVPTFRKDVTVPSTGFGLKTEEADDCWDECLTASDASPETVQFDYYDNTNLMAQFSTEHWSDVTFVLVDPHNDNNDNNDSLSNGSNRMRSNIGLLGLSTGMLCAALLGAVWMAAMAATI